MIFKNVQSFLEWRDDTEDWGFQKEVWLTSGGFDPLHVGHLRCLRETSFLAKDAYRHLAKYPGLVAVLVNCDDFLKAKKGYAFMALQDRMEIVHSLQGVDAVIPWLYENDDFTVIKAIAQIKPRFFTKGGDRNDSTNIPEWEICKKVKCKIITGVGGKKIRSSSELVENADRFNLEAVELTGWTHGYTKGRDSK
jgi:glycerol-3-phosphate cytidylyltransferase-like family protein